MITASEKQLSFIQTLMQERDYSGLNVSSIEERVQYGPLSKQDASTLISMLMGSPRNAKVAPAVSEGFYILDETVYRVCRSKSTGNSYAKVLKIAETGKGSWEYAPGAIKNLKNAEALTLEVAKQMGAHYGICVICGATLTDPESVERGIGPICADKI